MGETLSPNPSPWQGEGNRFMTTQNLIDFVKDHAAFDLDLYPGESPTDAEVVELLNWALRILSRKLWLVDPSIVITLVAGTQSYDLRSASLSRDVWLCLRAYINGSPLLDWQGEQVGLWTLEEMEATNPTWRAAANGTPTAAMVIDRKIYFYLKPSSTVVSTGSNYVAGCYLAADLAAGSLSAVPDIPDETQEALGLLATVKGSTPNVSEEEGWARLKEFHSGAFELVEEIAAANRAAIFGGWNG